MQVGFVLNSIFIGYSIGSAPIIGYHYGAKNHVEVRNVFKKSCVINIITGIIMTMLSILLAIPISKLFVGYNMDLVNLTTRAMRIYAFSFILYSLDMFTSSFFTALNNGLISAISSTCRTLIFQTLSVLLIPLIFRISGIWFAIIIIAEILSLILNTTLILTHRKNIIINLFYFLIIEV